MAAQNDDDDGGKGGTLTVGERSHRCFRERHIDGSEGPRSVFFRFQVMDVHKHMGTHSVDVVVAVYLRWFDPALVGLRAGEFTRTAEEYASLWSPRVELNDCESSEELWDAHTAWNFKNPRTGEMKLSQKYRATLVNRHDLSDFPFDSCDVRVSIGPQFYRKTRVELVFDRELAHPARTDVTSTSTEWEVDPVHEVLAESAGSHSHGILRITLHRLSSFFLWKILLLTSVCTSWSWFIFFQPPEEFSERTSNALTIFLAVTAFLYSVNDSLPKISYLTVLDKLLLYTFLLIFGASLESLVVFALRSENKWFSLSASVVGVGSRSAELAETIDACSFVLFPLLFLAINVYFIAGALRRKARSHEVRRRTFSFSGGKKKTS